MTQLTLDIPPEFFQPKPKTLSRQARRVYWLMHSMPSARMGFVFMSQEYLARKLGKSVRSVIRWIQELVQFGILSLRRRGPRSNEYRFLKDVENSGKPVEDGTQSQPSVRSSVTSSRGSSLYESKNTKRIPSETTEDAAKISLAEENVADTKIGGKPADRPLVKRLAALLPTREHWEVLRHYVREFSRRDTVRGWGIVVRLAEQVQLKSS